MSLKFTYEIELLEGYNLYDLTKVLNNAACINGYHLLAKGKQLSASSLMPLDNYEMVEPWVDEEEVCPMDLPEEKMSSVVKQIEYNWPAKEMRVTFQTGKVYIYTGVPIVDYTNFVQADSKGKHFNEYIKGNFNFRKE